jgi:molybdenum-dependent DNA-binding transcriptional regulator ModE
MRGVPVENFQRRHAKDIKQGRRQRFRLLKNLADNYTLEQAAGRMNISYQTAKYHMAQLRKLSGCMNIGGVMGWAFRKKLVR